MQKKHKTTMKNKYNKTMKNKYNKTMKKTKFKNKSKINMTMNMNMNMNMKGGVIDFCINNNLNNKYNFLTNGKELNGEPFEKQVLKLFAFENCNKTKNDSICNTEQINKLANLINNRYTEYPKTKVDLIGFLQEQIKIIFNINLSESNSILPTITTWDEFKKSDKKCNYNKFRKLVVDYLIITIIIYLFNDKSNNSNNSNYTISKGETQIFDSQPENLENKISINYQVVGSEDVTSDYDISIFSVPYNNLIPIVNSIFNNTFSVGLGKSSAEIFDTNLYCHPFYIFIDPKLPKYAKTNTNSDLFLELSENKYFLNSGHDAFYKNGILFSNLVYFDASEKYNFAEFLNKNGVFKEQLDIKQKITACDGKFCGFCDYEKCEAKQILNNNTKNSNNTPRNKFCGIDTKSSINSQECKSFLTHLLYERSELDNISIVFLLELYNNGITNGITNELELITEIKKRYISPMILSLWYADETYSTFSAYFHVIHCLGIPDQNMETINTLLTTMKQSFINICRVSALDNFAFMFHSFNLNKNEFVKKTAKYIARISHACAIIKMLSNSDPQFTLSKENIKKFQNLGNHTFITNTYKKNLDSQEQNLKDNGILTLELKSLLDKSKTTVKQPEIPLSQWQKLQTSVITQSFKKSTKQKPLSRSSSQNNLLSKTEDDNIKENVLILKTIYEILINKNTHTNNTGYDFGITTDMFCIELIPLVL